MFVLHMFCCNFDVNFKVDRPPFFFNFLQEDMKSGKEIDDKTFYKKLDDTAILSDDEMEEVRLIGLLICRLLETL